MHHHRVLSSSSHHQWSNLEKCQLQHCLLRSGCALQFTSSALNELSKLSSEWISSNRQNQFVFHIQASITFLDVLWTVLLCPALHFLFVTEEFKFPVRIEIFRASLSASSWGWQADTFVVFSDCNYSFPCFAVASDCTNNLSLRRSLMCYIHRNLDATCPYR